jgi:hypothetical protein
VLAIPLTVKKPVFDEISLAINCLSCGIELKFT